jgi:transposase-like protein
MLSIDDLFKGRHFDREIIILCVRWYLRFKLSFRDLVEMIAERGISLAHTTIMRWIQRYVPEFEKRWNRFACRAGASWRVDETYVKIKGRWTYLYRAVDKEGKTVDFLLRAKLDVAAAKAFFRRAFKSQGRLPRAITLDGYQASHRAARERRCGRIHSTSFCADAQRLSCCRRRRCPGRRSSRGTRSRTRRAGMPSSSEATLESFRFSYRTVGRQPLDGENNYAHDPEEDLRILRRPVQWDERQNDQYRTDSPLDPIVQSDRNQFDGSSREVGQKRHE